MAAGVPVISTNVGGLPEINLDGKTGYLGDVGDTQHMSACTIKLLTQPKLLEEFKKNAARQADQFDIGKIVPQYEALYNRFL